MPFPDPPGATVHPHIAGFGAHPILSIFGHLPSDSQGNTTLWLKLQILEKSSELTGTKEECFPHKHTLTTHVPPKHSLTLLP